MSYTFRFSDWIIKSVRTKHSSIGDENMYSLLLGLFYLFLGFSAYRKFREKWINDKIGNAVFFS